MSLFAVGFSYGLKGGGNLAVFGGQDSYQDGAYECKYKLGFSTGMFASISSTDVIAVESAILFSLKGTKVELEGLEGYEYDNLYYIELPLVLKIYPPIPLRIVRLNIFAGPYFGIDVLNRYRTTDEVKEFYQLLGMSTKGEYEDVKTFDWGVVGGLGADIGRILFEVSYSMAATSLDDSMYDYALTNWVLTLMLGYRLR
jgi:hypothetical protein